MASQPEPVPNDHIARAGARHLLNVMGPDCDERCKLTYVSLVDPVDPTHRRAWGDNNVRTHTNYDLTLWVKEASTLEDALKQWAAPELLLGDNCYRHDELGKVEAVKRQRLATLPDTLTIDLGRNTFDEELDKMVVLSNHVQVPLVLDFAQLGEDLLMEASDTTYALVACVVGALRHRSSDDTYVCWHMLIRVPGTEKWHLVNKDFLAQSLQYTKQRGLPTWYVREVLNGVSLTPLFCMKAWYQKTDANVRTTTPSAAEWQESWHEGAELSVWMDSGGRAVGGAAVGIPVASVVA
jgi:hypothetical protein